MTITSMTAYARQAQQAPWGELIWELRSVNHRFLDISLRLPEEFNLIEIKIREQLRQRLGRGKVMALLTYIPGKDAPFQPNINPAVMQQLSSLKSEIEPYIATRTDLVKLLKWPGLLMVTTENVGPLCLAVQQLLTLTLDDLIATRQREGEQLRQFIHEKLVQMQEQITHVRQQGPQAEQSQRERLQQRLQDLYSIVDPQRLQQEILFYLQKIDIVEEVQRLQTHIAETKRVLSTGGIVGRRLDFLVQEMQREVNTMGSKSNDVIIQKAGLELKVLIEQIREQVQNIE